MVRREKIRWPVYRRHKSASAMIRLNFIKDAWHFAKITSNSPLLSVKRKNRAQSPSWNSSSQWIQHQFLRIQKITTFSSCVHFHVRSMVSRFVRYKFSFTNSTLFLALSPTWFAHIFSADNFMYTNLLDMTIELHLLWYDGLSSG